MAGGDKEDSAQHYDLQLDHQIIKGIRIPNLQRLLTWNRCHDFANLESVKNGRFSCPVESQYKDAEVLGAPKARKEAREQATYRENDNSEGSIAG